MERADRMGCNVCCVYVRLAWLPTLDVSSFMQSWHIHFDVEVVYYLSSSWGHFFCHWQL